MYQEQGQKADYGSVKQGIFVTGLVNRCNDQGNAPDFWELLP